jgi:hypothetical protein
MCAELKPFPRTMLLCDAPVGDQLTSKSRIAPAGTILPDPWYGVPLKSKLRDCLAFHQADVVHIEHLLCELRHLAWWLCSCGQLIRRFRFNLEVFLTRSALIRIKEGCSSR